MDIFPLLVTGLFGVFVGAIAVMAASVPSSTYDKLKSEAIDRGYAQYNPTTGEWQWK